MRWPFVSRNIAGIGQVFQSLAKLFGLADELFELLRLPVNLAVLLLYVPLKKGQPGLQADKSLVIS